MFAKYSKKHWLIIFVYGVVNILTASSYSLQNPFSPIIAEENGITRTQYGFVFGVFSLFAIIMNPVVGIMIVKFGAVVMSLSGLVLIGIACNFFGFVEKINGFSLFLGTSIAIRNLEAVGFSMVCTAGMTIVSFEFSAIVEMSLAVSQIFTSTGRIMGPVIGCTLYVLGGFFLPFSVVGTLLLFAAFVVLFVPKDYPKKEAKSIKRKEILRMLRTSTNIMGFFLVVWCFVTFTFIGTVLEPYIRSFNLFPIKIGSVFLCNALTFGCACLFRGKLWERYGNAALICSLSTLFILCVVTLLGPAPYLFLDKTLYLCLFGILIQVFGLGGEQIAGFSFINKGATLVGLPQSIQTYGIVSAIYSSSKSPGGFLGAFLWGHFYDTFDFGWGSQILILYNLFLCIGAMSYLFFKCHKPKHDNNLNNILSSSKQRIWKMLK